MTTPLLSSPWSRTCPPFLAVDIAQAAVRAKHRCHLSEGADAVDEAIVVIVDRHAEAEDLSRFREDVEVKEVREAQAQRQGWVRGSAVVLRSFALGRRVWRIEDAVCWVGGGGECT